MVRCAVQMTIIDDDDDDDNHHHMVRRMRHTTNEPRTRSIEKLAVFSSFCTIECRMSSKTDVKQVQRRRKKDEI